KEIRATTIEPHAYFILAIGVWFSMGFRQHIATHGRPSVHKVRASINELTGPRIFPFYRENLHARRRSRGERRCLRLDQLECQLGGLADQVDGPFRIRQARQLYRSEEHTSELQSPCNLVC